MIEIESEIPWWQKEKWKMKFPFLFLGNAIVVSDSSLIKVKNCHLYPSVWQINFHILLTDIIYYLIYVFRDMETHRRLQSTKYSILKVINRYVKQLGNFLHKHLSKRKFFRTYAVCWILLNSMCLRQGKWNIVFAANITIHSCVVRYAFVLSGFVFQTAV